MVFDFASDEKLLGIDEICQKLAISRTTFERLRKPQHGMLSAMVRASDEYSGMPPFPNATITLGRSPRWSASDLNAWIASGSVESPVLGHFSQKKGL